MLSGWLSISSPNLKHPKCQNRSAEQREERAAIGSLQNKLARQARNHEPKTDHYVDDCAHSDYPPGSIPFVELSWWVSVDKVRHNAENSWLSHRVPMPVRQVN